MKAAAIAKSIVKRSANGVATIQDQVVVEEPLEIRVDSDTVAVTMRTPSAADKKEDQRLAIGFLFGEGLIDSIDDVAHVAHCGKPGDKGFGNIIDVRSGPGVSIEAERVMRSRRFENISAACGVCGRQTIEDLLALCRPQTPDRGAPKVSSAQIFSAMAALATTQTVFAQTGGLHGAAAFDDKGATLAVAEDVGRHNAVDKVIGSLLYARTAPASLAGPALLCVSGRSSFEILQKAARAQIPIVAAVSAPTSLAIELAVAMGITLLGFVRAPYCNVYSHVERLAL